MAANALIQMEEIFANVLNSLLEWPARWYEWLKNGSNLNLDDIFSGVWFFQEWKSERSNSLLKKFTISRHPRPIFKRSINIVGISYLSHLRPYLYIYGTFFHFFQHPTYGNNKIFRKKTGFSRSFDYASLQNPFHVHIFLFNSVDAEIECCWFVKYVKLKLAVSMLLE